MKEQPDNNKEQAMLKEAQIAYKKGFVGQYIAKGASVEEATKRADAAIAAIKKAGERKQQIREVIAARQSA